MTHAYHEIYLSKAQALLGDAFDYAVNDCGIPGEDFVKMFLVSSSGKRLENGEPACLAGRSGIELARDIIAETTGKEPAEQPGERFSRSAEYWIGWAVAYYQWYSDRKYGEIFRAVPYEDLERMYPTLHEADVTKFAEIMDARIRERFPETNLKRMRMNLGFTQAELAERSGVGLRSIQMYEQRNKNINKASADTLHRLARALNCAMETLMEHD